MTTEIEIPPCGAHCGVMAGRTGHCDCDLCHGGSAPVVITRSDLLTSGPKASMCDQWYAGIGDYRPWQAGQHQPPPTTEDQFAILDRLVTTAPEPGRPVSIKLTAPVPVPDVLACPQCGDRVFLDAADPDDDLAAFWHHLGQHTQDPVSRLRLWTAAMGGGEAGGP